MPSKPRTLCSQILELAVYSRLLAESWTRTCQTQGPAGTPRFYLGQRVQTTVDEIGLGSSTPAPAGSTGVIAMVPTKWDPDYVVILDGDQTRRKHAYREDELAPAT